MVRERSNYGHRCLLALSHALLSLLYVWVGRMDLCVG